VTPSGLLFGAEADFSFPGVLISNLPLTFPAAGPSDRLEIFGSLRGRIGYAFGDYLIYGMGGFAYNRDLATSTDAAGDVDRVYFWRPGWTAGAGVEVRLTSNLSARLEYAFFDLERAGIFFPAAGENYFSNLKLQTASIGLNYRFSDDPVPPGTSGGILPDLKDFSIHAQSTVIGQGNVPFPAAYSGAHSLFSGYQVVDTVSVTGFLGYNIRPLLAPSSISIRSLSRVLVSAEPLVLRDSRISKRKRPVSIIPITTRRACFCARSGALAASRRISQTAPIKSARRPIFRG
jgi:high affinity Mn2+ porin